MRNKVRNIAVLLLAAMMGAVAVVGGTVLAERKVPAKESTSDIPYEDLRTFTEVFRRIKSDYVEDVDDKKLLTDAIQGMLAGLDPHSSYLDPQEFKDMAISTKGKFGGLGIEVTMEDGFVKVISPIEDTPASRAGIKTGDLIIRIDDSAVKGMTLSDAVKLMRGKPGTKIRLTISREGENKPLEVTLKRAVIHIKSVKNRLLEPGYGYIRITNFQDHTAKNMTAAIERMRRESKGNLKGLVLDLRNNPGGILDEAVYVSDAFLSKGRIVYTEGRLSDSRLSFDAKSDDVLGNAPMVVLVNGGSASASEIVAGALQDHQRAIVMGTKTFGKGSVQTIMPMHNRAGLKLTTARYFTPNGRSIQVDGIKPDIITEEATVKKTQQQFERLREENLSRHLENADKRDEKKKGSAQAKDGGKEEDRDYQLQEALNLLKGINIYGGQHKKKAAAMAAQQ